MDPLERTTWIILTHKIALVGCSFQEMWTSIHLTCPVGRISWLIWFSNDSTWPADIATTESTYSFAPSCEEKLHRQLSWQARGLAFCVSKGTLWSVPKLEIPVESLPSFSLPSSVLLYGKWYSMESDPGFPAFFCLFVCADRPRFVSLRVQLQFHFAGSRCFF